jgi:hypothetical protein
VFVDVLKREKAVRETQRYHTCMGFAMRFYVLSLVVCLCVDLKAEESCNFEAKLLLVPTQVEAAIPLLHATRELRTRIYFYDTPALDLLSKGVILRLRQGGTGDLTVKLRPPDGKQFSDPSSGNERYKCEVEITGGVENRSYSVGTRFSAGHVPETGRELVHLLSPGQKRLLEDSQVRIDWAKVRRVADIQSASWIVRAQAPLNKVGMELWTCPNGRILEVSSKAAPDAGRAAYTALESLAKRKGLALSPVQQSKTATALEEMSNVQAR